MRFTDGKNSIRVELLINGAPISEDIEREIVANTESTYITSDWYANTNLERVKAECRAIAIPANVSYRVFCVPTARFYIHDDCGTEDFLEPLQTKTKIYTDDKCLGTFNSPVIDKMTACMMGIDEWEHLTEVDHKRRKAFEVWFASEAYLDDDEIPEGFPEVYWVQPIAYNGKQVARLEVKETVY